MVAVNTVSENRGEEWSLKLDLKENDSAHVEKFREFMESTHPIKNYQSKGFSDTYCTISRFRFNCPYLGKLLWNHYGLKPNRESFNMGLIPKDLWRHFIRGLVDADGSIVISNINESNGKSYIRSSLNIGGSSDNLVCFAEYFKEKGLAPIIPIVRQRHGNRDGSYRTISYCGNQRCRLLLDFLYKDATIYLDRKYEKYLEVKKLGE